MPLLDVSPTYVLICPFSLHCTQVFVYITDLTLHLVGPSGFCLQIRQFCLPQGWPLQRLDVVSILDSFTPALSTILILLVKSGLDLSSASLSDAHSSPPGVLGTKKTQSGWDFYIVV